MNGICKINYLAAMLAAMLAAVLVAGTAGRASYGVSRTKP